MAHKHRWTKASTTIEDAGRGVEVRVLFRCATCREVRESVKRIRPPAPTAKAVQLAAMVPTDGTPTDEAAQWLAALGFKQAEIPGLLKGAAGTTQERVATALQRNGA